MHERKDDVDLRHFLFFEESRIVCDDLLLRNENFCSMILYADDGANKQVLLHR